MAYFGVAYSTNLYRGTTDGRETEININPDSMNYPPGWKGRCHVLVSKWVVYRHTLAGLWVQFQTGPIK
jgi:hypothetical protein